jgi:hypothetical protein
MKSSEAIVADGAVAALVFGDHEQRTVFDFHENEADPLPD